MRSLLLFVTLVGAAAWFGTFLNDKRPLREWLFLDLVKIFGWELLLSAACASFGHLLLGRVLRIPALPSFEKLALSFPLGLAAFGAGIYLGGFAHALGRVYAVLLPLAMLAAGARDAWVALQRLRPPVLLTSPVGVAATAFGTLGIAILYLGVFTPESINYDAAWNHLVIAQDYAREGRIVPFPADWVKNVPHLGSVVNTWAFLVPGFDKPVLRWMMAQHDEFLVFIWTLVGVAAGARYLSERPALRGSWAALFLFPGIFVYDGNMGCAADHFLALFAIPVFLASARFFDHPDPRHGALLGFFAGASLLTKLQSLYLLVPIAGVIVLRSLYLCVRSWRRAEDTPPLRQVALGLAAGLCSMLLLASLHFGSNWVFFHNPFFPLAQGSIRSRPYIPDAQLQMDYLFAYYGAHPPKVFSERFMKALEMVFTFSFTPHYSYAGNVPTFGSLFTLLLPSVLFIGWARKLWLAVAVCLGALFVWAMTFWVDRNLQAFMPLLAAVVGASIARVWEVGTLARVGLTALVGLQLVWASDWYFSGTDRITRAFTLIRSGMDGKEKTRFEGFRDDFLGVGKALPKDAVVVLHDQHLMLGIDRKVLLDWVGFQGVIDYRTLRTPRDVYDRFRALGVTHVLWMPGSRAAPYRQEEVVFDLFAYPLKQQAKSFGAMSLSPMPDEPPAPSAELNVVVWKVSKYEDGYYPVSKLNTCEEMPPEMQTFQSPDRRLVQSELEGALGGADAVLIGDATGLDAGVVNTLATYFYIAQQTASLTVYGRNSSPH